MRLYKRLLVNNDCFKAGVPIVPKGIMVHSTGANNPRLSRYVQPDDGRLGSNPNGNHWNQPRPGGRQVCVHALIGKLADGSVATYQTLPWDIRGWHSGYANAKSKTNANKLGYIGFEICEDGLTDPAYFRAVYREAVELTAYLCLTYHLDPLKDGVVICHAEGHRRGIASNHGDVLHWFPRHGKTMDDFRADVAREMKGNDDMSEEEFYRMFLQAQARYTQELNKKPADKWAGPVIKTAVDNGLMAEVGKPGEGKIDRPLAPATRQELAAVAAALLDK